MPLFRTTTLNLQLLTPMFLSGAEQTDAELRSASIRGILRFWFRATRGAEIDPQMLREEEAKLFGASAGDSGRGSAIVVRVRGPEPGGKTGEQVAEVDEDLRAPSKLPGWPGQYKPPVNPISYLGYGPYQYEKGSGFVAKREHFNPRSPLTVDLVERFPLDAEQRRRLQLAAWCWISFGGTGSRARKGFGSFVADDPRQHFDALDPELRDGQLNDAAWRALPLQGTPMPPFTRFSSGARCFLGPAHKYGADALGWLGKHYKTWRLQLEGQPHVGTRRGWLGAPLNIDKKPWAPKVLTDKKSADAADRRASPYFLHVGRDNSSGFLPVVLYLPAVYSPDLAEPDRTAEIGRLFNERILATPGVRELGGPK